MNITQIDVENNKKKEAVKRLAAYVTESQKKTKNKDTKENKN